MLRRASVKSVFPFAVVVVTGKGGKHGEVISVAEVIKADQLRRLKASSLLLSHKAVVPPPCLSPFLAFARKTSP
jgi:hypothetical protein